MQAVRGQLEVLTHREPLEAVIADPGSDPELVARLEVLRDARRFASEDLQLPDNDSYRSYADIGRDYVVWNVIAAPEFSLQPKTWCYIVVGCVAYRGYFSEQAARNAAGKLRERDFDVFVGGVSAYSTLGRFADPILNTMMQRDEIELVQMLFHELAHQRLYIKDDTEFNESFASAVATVGLRRWLLARGNADALERWQRRQARRAAVARLVEAAGDDLAHLYASGLPAADMRQQKQQRLEQLSQALAERTGNPGWRGSGLNNARLASLRLYAGKVPGFLAMYEQCDGDLACFYALAEELAERPPASRDAALRRTPAQGLPAS
ncbi:MAG TPA: aminopeptidase [Woeseiaceae bacterium]|nr:aminopeptidase [Woeseiaceae bacterium]